LRCVGTFPPRSVAREDDAGERGRHAQERPVGAGAVPGGAREGRGAEERPILQARGVRRRGRPAAAAAAVHGRGAGVAARHPGQAEAGGGAARGAAGDGHERGRVRRGGPCQGRGGRPGRGGRGRRRGRARRRGRRGVGLQQGSPPVAGPRRRAARDGRLLPRHNRGGREGPHGGEEARGGGGGGGGGQRSRSG